eukprot:4251935-Amphidinium_carterae.2
MIENTRTGIGGVLQTARRPRQRMIQKSTKMLHCSLQHRCLLAGAESRTPAPRDDMIESHFQQTLSYVTLII